MQCAVNLSSGHAFQLCLKVGKSLLMFILYTPSRRKGIFGADADNEGPHSLTRAFVICFLNYQNVRLRCWLIVICIRPLLLSLKIRMAVYTNRHPGVQRMLRKLVCFITGPLMYTKTHHSVVVRNNTPARAFAVYIYSTGL